jgi:hypothetical protein
VCVSRSRSQGVGTAGRAPVRSCPESRPGWARAAVSRDRWRGRRPGAADPVTVAGQEMFWCPVCAGEPGCGRHLTTAGDLVIDPSTARSARLGRSSGHRPQGRSAAAQSQCQRRRTRSGNGGWCGPSSPGWQGIGSRCRAPARPSHGRTGPGPGPVTVTVTVITLRVGRERFGVFSRLD